MAHHFVILTLKENITEVPYKYLIELSKLTDIDVTLHLERDNIQLRYNSYFWDYEYDIEELFKNNEITEITLEAYKWFRENTTISSDCWNVNDAEFGPHSWGQLDNYIKRVKDKYLPG